MPRFFVDTPFEPGTAVALPETVARHIQVLRLQNGAAITLFDGRGTACEATLTHVEKRRAVCEVAHLRAPAITEPPYGITLVQGIASNEKMDWLIEKAVELGVQRIVPVVATRSVVRLSGDLSACDTSGMPDIRGSGREARTEKRLAHWRALTRAACEQCGRDTVPAVLAPVSLAGWLAHAERGQSGWLLTPHAEGDFDASLPRRAPPHAIDILIGPEGGWTNDEETQALAAGYAPLRLGARVLRTETAGMALLAALAARWGGW